MVLPGHTCSTLAPHVRQVRSIAKGIMASTEGTKVSSEGVKVHLKEYKKQCDNVAALAKFPGVLGTPMEAVRMCHDKLVDAALAGLRKEHTPTFEIAGLSAGPSKAEVLEGGRQRKQAGGGMGGKEASPTKDDAVPAGKKPAAGRRSGPLLPADEGPATTHTSVHSSSTPASAAGISPTPLAQAAFDSVSGTPKSTPDRPFSDVCDKLASLDAKLSTKATIMELTAQLNAANVKATMFEDKANTIEQEMKTTAAAVATSWTWSWGHRSLRRHAQPPRRRGRRVASRATAVYGAGRCQSQ
jgi:hypothetical protein